MGAPTAGVDQGGPWTRRRGSLGWPFRQGNVGGGLDQIGQLVHHLGGVGAGEIAQQRLDRRALRATLLAQGPQQEGLGGQVAHGGLQGVIGSQQIDQAVGQAGAVLQRKRARLDPFPQLQTQFSSLTHGPGHRCGSGAKEFSCRGWPGGGRGRGSASAGPSPFRDWGAGPPWRRRPAGPPPAPAGPPPHRCCCRSRPHSPAR